MLWPMSNFHQEADVLIRRLGKFFSLTIYYLILAARDHQEFKVKKKDDTEGFLIVVENQATNPAVNLFDTVRSVFEVISKPTFGSYKIQQQISSATGSAAFIGNLSPLSPQYLSVKYVIKSWALIPTS